MGLIVTVEIGGGVVVGEERFELVDVRPYAALLRSSKGSVYGVSPGSPAFVGRARIELLTERDRGRDPFRFTRLTMTAPREVRLDWYEPTRGDEV